MRTRRTIAAGLFLLGIGGKVLAQPEPFFHHDGTVHYYNVIAAPSGTTWSAASDSAQRLGGYLATTTSPDENNLVFGLAASSGNYWHKRPGQGDWAGPWLGGRQRPGAPEPDSGWEWVTGEPFTFDNWSPGAPDNHGDENRLNFGESQSGAVPTWNDLSGGDAAIRGFVLELSAESTTIGLLRNDTDAFVGYTLFQPDYARRIYLIDNKGRRVHYWYSPYPAGKSNYLLEDGSLLRAGYLGNHHFEVGGAGGRISRLAWEGNLTWAYVYSSDSHCQHHDIEPLPNGNVLFIAWEKKTRDEAIAAGRDPDRIWNNEVWPDHVVEVNPTDDSIVWKWHVWDHLIQDFDSTKANYGVVAEHPELVDVNYIRPDCYVPDWMHSNAVDYNPQFDQILLSVRELGEVWVIDHSTTTEEASGHSGGRSGMGGDILYRWGNPQVYRAGDAADQKFYGHHDARWVEDGLPGAGHIMVFNNGVDRPGGDYSTVDEFIPPCDSTGRYERPEPGTPFGPDERCWMYGATPPTDFYSKYISGAHRLPNGNTLICDGGKGEFFEVSLDQVVWRYVNPVTENRLFQGDTVPDAYWGKRNSAFRVTRYSPDYPGLAGRDLTPGYPLERYSPPPTGLAETPARTEPGRAAILVRPSPARTGAAISVQLAARSEGEVSLFDAGGRLVRAWPVSRGASSITWNGTDDRGRRLPAAVYFIRLETQAGSATHQLVLLQ